jgi:phage gp36-like protein
LSYITQQDLEDELGENRLVQLTDDQATGEVNPARVGKAISYAEGTFEAYARTRYTLPVPVTEKVKSLCLDLAVFHLFKSRALSTEGVYEVKKHAHDAAIKFLEALQKGTAALDVPAAEETATSPASPDRVLRGSSSSKPVFTDEKMDSY